LAAVTNPCFCSIPTPIPFAQAIDPKASGDRTETNSKAHRKSLKEPEMKLESFRIQNFRSITDSGEVSASRITALLGRNESGKSNLLKALHSLNPAEGIKKLIPIKDFPRHRRLEECKDNTPVVYTRWSLNSEDQQELAKILPRAIEITQVRVSRPYAATRSVGLVGLPELAFSEAEIKAKIRKISPAIFAAAESLDETNKPILEAAGKAFEEAVKFIPDRKEWAKSAAPGIKALMVALASAGTELYEEADQMVASLEDLSGAIEVDDVAQDKLREWALKKLPIFIYLDEYPELNGHQDVGQFLARKEQGQLNEPDHSFEKLCKVSGLDPTALQDYLNRGEIETRNQLVNRASAVVTAEVKRLWKDRPLKIRFNIDAQHLDTLISDPNATYDVEVNLNERSRGFQWFFAFYITFSADTNGGTAENAVLLLDEPGLYLHAKSQADLLTHFEKDFDNQIIYSTHSPFMVPTHRLESVRTVNISEEGGTTVTNDPSGDSRTLFPLQAALGYSIAQSLFIGPHNLVVEGVTDFWILSSISAYLVEIGGKGLRSDLTITPAGGAQKVSYMVALLTSESLNVIVLLDTEKDSKLTKDDLVKGKLIANQNIIFTSEAYAADQPKEADIEDLLDPAIYEALVRESYSSELKGKILSLNPGIPRIAKRVEAGFKDLGIPFHKTRPTSLLLRKMAESPEAIISSQCKDRFETLFMVINDRLEKQLKLL
jgi:predicted ATPase